MLEVSIRETEPDGEGAPDLEGKRYVRGAHRPLTNSDTSSIIDQGRFSYQPLG
jgi:hypothetical protein